MHLNKFLAENLDEDDVPVPVSTLKPDDPQSMYILSVMTQAFGSVSAAKKMLSAWKESGKDFKTFLQDAIDVIKRGGALTANFSGHEKEEELESHKNKYIGAQLQSQLGSAGKDVYGAFEASGKTFKEFLLDLINKIKKADDHPILGHREDDSEDLKQYEELRNNLKKL